MTEQMTKKRWYSRRLTDFEIRENGQGSVPTLTGHAAVFNERTELFSNFFEQFAPGAFTDTIKNDDIRALSSHMWDVDHVLGRTTNGTLRLSEDKVGLAFEIDPPNTQHARDVTELISRGDVTGMSIGFYLDRDQDYEFEQGDDYELVTIKRSRLLEISTVPFPAYESTDVSVEMRDEASIRAFYRTDKIKKLDPISAVERFKFASGRHRDNRPLT